MTKDEFNNWKSSSATQEIFSIIHERILDLRTDLGQSAGLDTREDGKKVGAIQAYVDFLTIDYEETRI